MIHFYLFQKQSFILISDLAKEKIVKKYGNGYEIINSIKDKGSLDIVKQRVLRSYSKFEVIEKFKTVMIFTPEIREKIRQSKLGKKRSEEDKRKISQSRKGRGNFQGKRHTEESKRKTSRKMIGNKHAENGKDKFWIYSPELDKETKVDSRNILPDGYRIGRDPEVIQQLLSSGNKKNSFNRFF